MRVFLRSKKTGLYYTRSNEWAAAPGLAREFASVPHANSFALAGGLPQTEIVLRCDLLEEEVTMPLVSELRDLDRPTAAAA